jgi:hypothetical protein
MNTEILKHIDDIFADFHGRRPTGRMEAFNFCSTIMDICVNSLYELAQEDYEAYGTMEGWKPSVKKFAEFLGLNPEDIFGFPIGVEFVRTQLDNLPKLTDSDAETLSLIGQTVIDLGREENGDKLIDVIVSRFVKDHSLQSIGDRYDLTRERIRQLERRAIRIMRENLEVRMAQAA